MKSVALLCLVFFAPLFFAQKKGFNEDIQRREVSRVLDQLNAYAAAADFKNYFNLFAGQSSFIGTDATEIWNKQQFMEYAKPYFYKGKAWTFTSLQRNIYFSEDGKYAWFDELLDTQMKICRGSGILQKINAEWKIRQYVLSMTVPNENSKEIIRIKTPVENNLLEKFQRTNPDNKNSK